MKNIVILGDVRKQSHMLDDNFFQCIITSPPYFGHRFYTEGNPDEIGKESNLLDYIDHLVCTFNLLRHKLHDNGLLWLNLGDTYREKALLGVPWRVLWPYRIMVGF